MPAYPSIPKWAPILYIAESVIVVLLAVYAFSCSIDASYFYHDNQLICTGISVGSVLYLGAIGSRERWSIVFLLLMLGLFILLGILLRFSTSEWIGGPVWIVYIAAAIGVVGHFYKRLAGWLLPLSALASLVALIGQVTYSSWRIGYIFDTLALLLMVAETTGRSIATLVGGHYFYSYYFLRRSGRRRAAIAAFMERSATAAAPAKEEAPVQEKQGA